MRTSRGSRKFLKSKKRLSHSKRRSSRPKKRHPRRGKRSYRGGQSTPAVPRKRTRDDGASSSQDSRLPSVNEGSFNVNRSIEKKFEGSLPNIVAEYLSRMDKAMSVLLQENSLSKDLIQQAMFAIGYDDEKNETFEKLNSLLKKHNITDFIKLLGERYSSYTEKAVDNHTGLTPSMKILRISPHRTEVKTIIDEEGKFYQNAWKRLEQYILEHEDEYLEICTDIMEYTFNSNQKFLMGTLRSGLYKIITKTLKKTEDRYYKLFRF